MGRTFCRAHHRPHWRARPSDQQRRSLDAWFDSRPGYGNGRRDARRQYRNGGLYNPRALAAPVTIARSRHLHLNGWCYPRFPGISMYSAAKAALSRFSEAVNAEYRRRGVTAGIVYLGFVENDPDKEIYSADGRRSTTPGAPLKPNVTLHIRSSPRQFADANGRSRSFSGISSARPTASRQASSPAFYPRAAGLYIPSRKSRGRRIEERRHASTSTPHDVTIVLKARVSSRPSARSTLPL
jgi:NAD(P)-dependent dehydrogenase (short-subunit alcohol dehydrogenase family)